MCGRYASSRSAADLSALFEASDGTAAAGGVAPRYNIAPTDAAPLVRWSRRRGGRVLEVGRWGLFGSARMINARVETAATSRAYAACFAQRRALIPVDGWYEWRRDQAGRRQAYFMTPQDGGVLALAGLWAATDGGVTFSVLTTAATAELAAVHDRMPVVLSPPSWQEWLASEAPAGLATPSAEALAGLEIRPVGAAVGNVRNDGPSLVERIEPLVQQGLW